MRILEVYRTQERQNYLYSLGRTIIGIIRTYTLKSKHTDGLAMDILPINCTHKQLEAVAVLYGITHPLSFDPPHYELTEVGCEPPSLEHRLRNAEHALPRFLGTPRGEVLSRLIKRLQTLLGV